MDRKGEAAPRMAFGPRHLDLGGRGRRAENQEGEDDPQRCPLKA
jgi:hypothetical protein